MRAVDIIRRKRDGAALDREEIVQFVSGVTDGSMPDYQAAALLMAIVWRGMTPTETAWLTEAMIASGDHLDLSDVPGPKADKHSTGGVGDKTSLVLAPLAAACGLTVPMMSGRGLGHTGGTLDKLEAISGFRTNLTADAVKRVLRVAGCAIVGQTERMVPADRRLYALRDVTATVESVPLISASIMSKKIAEGIDALVLDVKCGSGAFMKSEASAVALAEAMIAIGRRVGVRTEALVTRMDAPLGTTVGNALEVREAVDTLAGRGPADLVELCLGLATRMLVAAGLEADAGRAGQRARSALDSGAALEHFAAMVDAQGGDASILADPVALPRAPRRHHVAASRTGIVVALDGEFIGRACVLLGGGRSRVDDDVDPAVGLVVLRKPGDPVRAGDPVLEIHYRDEASLAPAAALAGRAITIGDAAPIPVPLVLREIRDTE